MGGVLALRGELAEDLADPGSGGLGAVVLLMLISSGVWSRLNPAPCNCLSFVTIPNFWWQLGSVATLAALALFCGWLQGIAGWTPPEYAVEPPAAPEDHAGH